MKAFVRLAVLIGLPFGILIFTAWLESQVDPKAPPPVKPGCIPVPGVDTPDAEFADSDCDGIDGSIDAAFFVSPQGSDLATSGTPLQPFRTVSAALRAAASSPHRKNIYVAAGHYREHVDLRSGISIWGGFDRTWARTPDSVTETKIFDGPRAEPSGLTGIGLQNVTLADLDVEAVFCRDCSEVRLERLTVRGEAGISIMDSTGVTLSDTFVASGSGVFFQGSSGLTRFPPHAR